MRERAVEGAAIGGEMVVKEALVAPALQCGGKRVVVEAEAKAAAEAEAGAEAGAGVLPLPPTEAPAACTGVLLLLPPELKVTMVCAGCTGTRMQRTK